MSNSTKRKRINKKRDISKLPPWAILRVSDICDCTGLAKSTLYQYIKDGKFPELLKIGERSSGQTVEKTMKACKDLAS